MNSVILYWNSKKNKKTQCLWPERVLSVKAVRLLQRSTIETLLCYTAFRIQVAVGIFALYFYNKDDQCLVNVFTSSQIPLNGTHYRQKNI